MMLASRRWGGPIGLACTLISLGLGGPAQAEPVFDRALSTAEVATRAGCAQLRVGFNLRIRYQSHFPPSHGSELRVNVRPLDVGRAASEILTRRESLRAPADKLASIKAIDLVSDAASGPMLVIQFHKPVYYMVAQGGDFESVVVAISGSKPSAACKPDTSRRPLGSGWAATVRAESPSTAEAGPIEAAPLPAAAARDLTDADRRSAAASMDEARAALKKGNPGTAIRLLTKLLKLPENEHSAEALEFLGLAYQRGKQPDGARLAYEAYLQRYPSGEGADRVRQRLAGILTATKEVGAAPEAPRKARKSSGGFQASPDGSPAWNVTGSASQFYIRDDSFHSIRDPSVPRDPNDDEDDHRVHRNVLLSSFDLIGSWSTEAFKSRIRFSGTEEHDFSGEDGEIFSVASLYYELAVRDWNTEARIGRQTRNTGGVLGRFDGALLSWQASPWLRLNAVGGAPVAHRWDEPFKDEKFLYGGSVDLGPFYDGLDVSLYAVEQRDRDWIDRQAIGAELRYLTNGFSAFGTVDYDVHYSELNAAILSGSWTWPDKSTLNGAFEFRKSPFLSTSTALQGQPFLTLYDLLKAHTLSEVEQLALDRTTEYRSASLGYSRLLTENLQLNLDVTASETSGSPASGGVPEMPDGGTEFYYSAQILASNVVRDGDAFIAGVRVADREDSNLYVLDLSARYPLTDVWRVSPRLRLGYREGDEIDLTEYSVLPSVLVNYHVTRDFSLELEAGANWTKTEVNGATVEDTEFFFTFGYRYDFYADKQSMCAAGAASCK